MEVILGAEGVHQPSPVYVMISDKWDNHQIKKLGLEVSPKVVVIWTD
jgi:hypothetical protein